LPSTVSFRHCSSSPHPAHRQTLSGAGGRTFSADASDLKKTHTLLPGRRLADRDGAPTCPSRAPEVTPWGEAEVLLRQGTSSALTRQLTSTATDERTCFSWDVIPPRPLPRSSRWLPPPLLSVPPLWPSPRQPPQPPTLTGTASQTASPVVTG